MTLTTSTVSIPPLGDGETDIMRGRHSRRRRRRQRTGLILLVVLALVLSSLAFVWFRLNSYAGDVKRLPAHEAFPAAAGRPAKPVVAEGSLTFLLVGSDRRAEGQTTGENATGPAFRYGAQRTDTIMLVHLSRKRDKAYAVSLPRDSWVNVPGNGMAKINAGYSWGGPPLLIETIEGLSKVRIDHLAIIDFEGFRSMTSALGGVDVKVRETTTDPRSGRTFVAGRNHLEGQAALDFVRQRYGLPRGDLDRVERQQRFMKALLSKAIDGSTLTNPLKLDDFLGAATSAATVDENLDNGEMRSLALSLRKLHARDMAFMTAPVSGFGREGEQSVVYLDPAKTKEMFKAMRRDTMDAYVATHKDSIAWAGR